MKKLGELSEKKIKSLEQDKCKLVEELLQNKTEIQELKKVNDRFKIDWQDEKKKVNCFKS
jgi:hypothetical protein